MTRINVTRKQWASVALLIVLAATGPIRSLAEEAAAATPSVRVEHWTPTPAERAELDLRRALAIWRPEAPRPALHALSRIDFSLLPPGRAGRASLLQALARQRLGLGNISRQSLPATRELETPYREAVAAITLLHDSRAGRLTESSGNPAGMAPVDGLVLKCELLLAAGEAREASRLLAADGGKLPKALRLYLEARVGLLLGEDTLPLWRKLAKRSGDSAWEVELIGYAALRLAARAIEMGEDSERWLDRVPRSSSAFARSRHLAALQTMAAGDSSGAARMLTDGLELESSSADRNAAALALARLRIAAGDEESAWRLLLDQEARWLDRSARLDALTDGSAADSLIDAAEGRALEIDSSAWGKALEELAREAQDLNEGRPHLRPLREARLAYEPVPSQLLDSPRADHSAARHQLHRSGAELSAARFSRDRVAFNELQLEKELAAREARLGRVRGRVLEELSLLGQRLAEADSLGNLCQANLVTLATLRDEALAELLERGARIRRRAELLGDAFHAMKRLRLDGPREARSPVPSADTVEVAEIVNGERMLNGEIDRFMDRFTNVLPDLLERSFTERWAPRFTGGAAAAAERLGDLNIVAEGLNARIDSAVADSALGLKLAEARRQISLERQAADSLGLIHEQAKLTLSDALLSELRSRHLAEREALDYTLADLAYLRSLDPDADLQARRTIAIGRVEGFLERHPESIARAEQRFRLADLALGDARDSFHARMAEYLGEGRAADAAAERALAPFLDYGPALDLYRAILAEDLDYEHRDAVLFNLGMLQDDAGDPNGQVALARLLREFPDSPLGQRAQLRLAEHSFAEGNYESAAEHYGEAARGADPDLRALSLYKLGWTRFGQDRFLDAAEAYRSLLDLQRSEQEQLGGDLDAEAGDRLIQSLARAGGATVFDGFFAGQGARPYEAEILSGLARLLRGYSLFADAAAADALWLDRYPMHPDGLEMALALIADRGAGEEPEQLLPLREELGRHFLPDGGWWLANDGDSLRAAASTFSHDCFTRLAFRSMQAARTGNDPADWQLALAHYETLIAAWPDDEAGPRRRLHAGEAARRLGDREVALAHFASATADSTLGGEADWQALSLLDEWQIQASETADPHADSLLARFLAAGDAFVVDRHEDARAPDALWRLGELRAGLGRDAEAARSFAHLSRRHADDARAPQAARLAGDAHFRDGAFAAAATIYHRAHLLAGAAGMDSLVTAMNELIPTARYRQAESQAADEGGACAAPESFTSLAMDWPDFAHADQAWYRAGLGHAACGDSSAALTAWRRLIDNHPDSGLRRDALLRSAELAVEQGRVELAAAKLSRYAMDYNTEADAPEALLQAADLMAGAGMMGEASRLRDRFLTHFAGETESVIEILHVRARNALAERGSTKLAVLRAEGEPLATYLEALTAKPDLADQELLAQVDFLSGEEAYAAYRDCRLDQPLPASLKRKQRRLEDLTKHYRDCLMRGQRPWTRAAAHRIGQALYDFGDALRDSERPQNLVGDDLIAYEEVMEEQAWTFFDRGEQAWTELLRQSVGDDSDQGNWILKTKKGLWPRLAQRFLHKPELEYPLVTAEAPALPAAGTPIASNE